MNNNGKYDLDSNYKSLIMDYPACDNPEIIDSIMKHGKKQSYKKGTIITTPGDQIDSIKFLYSGKIKVVMNDSFGYEKVLYILSNGWFLREGLFINNRLTSTAKNTTYAEEECIVYLIDRPAYEILSKETDFLQSLIKSCTIKRSVLVNEINNMTFMSARDRILQLLIASSQKNPDKMDSQWRNLKHKYSHQDMASILGMNRVTVSKVITALCKTGELRVLNQKIQINHKLL